MNNLRKLLYDAAMRLRGDEDGFVVGGGGAHTLRTLLLFLLHLFCMSLAICKVLLL